MAAKELIIALLVIALQNASGFFKTSEPAVKLYHIENDKFLQWPAARAHCEKLGMHLLSIKSPNESELLKKYIKNKYGRIYPYWLGAYKDEGVWKWIAYNEIIEKQQFMWHQGEPNDKSNHELCIHTWEEDFDWNDNDCEVPLPFICELQLVVLPSVASDIDFK